ncbi:CU044_5270 family protein [Phytohabitans sp. ZYX-F-186]|uniref:CU044_5270 family protein n=1 Tax=Phytohabitans maris TaxID=3071409 RepID=A0ABU0ZDN8_9ACTN|nr:CU044_5270 family protein [Phytohabitans sp. ZYX-F-186]MDQ7905157.1 CU044_5270 family protein [Phytohabitans sp. ZYX-F-186]
MMDELRMLREVFGPDEAAPPAAWERSRTALLDRIRAAEAPAAPRGHRRTRRWPVLAGLIAAAAAVGVVGMVAVENLGTPVARDGNVLDQRHAGGALPFARPASAAEVLENAAWTVSRKPWVAPRPDQFMYKEARVLVNDKALTEQAPNGPLVPGRTSVVRTQEWTRIDARVWANMDEGKLVVRHQERGMVWGEIPYDDLARLTTPEAVLAWQRAPKPYGVELDALLSRYVLPPAVEAAVFRAIARQEGVRLNPDAVNIDGRPAVGLGVTVDGYRSQELLFDKQTYALIGERSVAIADHTKVALDGTSHIRKGDLFRQAVYTASIIVDKVGDTR